MNFNCLWFLVLAGNGFLTKFLNTKIWDTLHLSHCNSCWNNRRQNEYRAMARILLLLLVCILCHTEIEQRFEQSSVCFLEGIFLMMILKLVDLYRNIYIAGKYLFLLIMMMFWFSFLIVTKKIIFFLRGFVMTSFLVKIQA